MTNERRPNTLQFDAETLRQKGFVQQADGTWAKPDFALGGLAAGEHTEQTGALERQTQAPRSRKAGRAKSGRRKRPAEIIVTMTAHLPRYFDDDHLAVALADWLGVDDGDRRVMWEHDQELTRGDPGVCVVIRPTAR